VPFARTSWTSLRAVSPALPTDRDGRIRPAFGTPLSIQGRSVQTQRRPDPTRSADYVNVITKRFTAIAKVDRLNLRFERGYGQLYDFLSKPAHHLCGGRVRPATPGQHQLRARSTPEYNVDYRDLPHQPHATGRPAEAGADAAPMIRRNAWRRPSAPRRAFDRF
jgi:hypothetical protein